MAGEQNGTSCLLYRTVEVTEGEVTSDVDNVLVGQLELTHTFSGAPIEISNKSLGDFVTYLDGELSTKGRNVSGSLIYSNDAEYQQLRADAMAGAVVRYMLDFTGLPADEIRFLGIPINPSDNLAMGDKVITSITITSVGEDL